MVRILMLVAAQVWDPAHPTRLEPALIQALAQLEGSPAYAPAAAEYARFLVAHGRKDEAEAWFRKSIGLRTAAADLESLAALGPPDAIALLTRAVAIRDKEGQPTALSRTLRRLGAAQEAQRESAAAEATYRRALPIATGAEVGLLANDIGLILENRNDMRGAEAMYRRALAAFERVHGPRHPEVGAALNNLAGSLGAQGRIAEAEPMLRRALATFDATVGPNHERTAATAANLGDLLDARGRTAEARLFYQRAATTYEALGNRAEAEGVRARMK